ncbi:hypothetical protein [Mesorhizobium sp. M0040]|uniref:hypothetical protein n=1 Tax=Mesorhizobium sp. M0040 TaxID=2956855 RepID=UPI00333E080B
MDDSYTLYGCIDFDTDSYAISVPVLRRREANYVYIPKTDNFFIVLDFYEVLELGYSVKHIDFKDQVPVTIGEKAPVPVIENGRVFLLDVDWSEQVIRTRLPALGNEAVKAFVSLRSRLADIATESAHAGLDAAMDDLLIDPVRSRYWISKFSALVRSAFEHGPPPGAAVTRIEAARVEWLEKFAAKSPLKLVHSILDVPNLSVQPQTANRVLLNRFESILLTKGIHVPNVELRAYEKMFPSGIFDAIRKETGGQYDYWRRRSDISTFIAQQMYTMAYPSDSTHGRVSDPKQWAVSTLSHLLLFFEVVEGDDTGLDNSMQYLLPLYDKCLEQVTTMVGDRYRLSTAIFEHPHPPSSRFLIDLLRALNIAPVLRPQQPEDWLPVLDEIIYAYRRLVIVSKIVHPLTRRLSDQEVAFKEIDHALMDAIKKAQSTKNISALRELLLPRTVLASRSD